MNLKAIRKTGLFLARKSQKYFLEQQEILGKMDGYIEEFFSGQQIVWTH